MEHQTFAPKITSRVDKLSHRLVQISRGTIVLMVALLPFFFIPSTPALLYTSKVFMTLMFLLIAVAVTGLAILRRGTMTISFPALLIAWWVVVLSGLVSAVLSPTLLASLIGNAIEVQTVGFLALLGCIMTMSLTFSDGKKPLMYLFAGVMGGAVILSIFHLVRIVLGPESLTLGVLSSGTATLIGGWNDLGIFLALSVVMILVSLIQLPLPKKVVIGVGIAVLPILMILTVINFFALWIILGLTSLMVLVYSLVRDRFSEAENTSPSLVITLVSALVFVAAVVNVLGGGALSRSVSSMTGIEYVEVRPSTTATLDIMRDVYQDNAFTGIGPNRFVDAWRLHKDASINETIFWNTDFTAGSGYIPTWFVTTGIIGVLAWFIFLATFLYSGFTMLMRGQTSDRFWYYIGSVSYLVGAFLWGMSIIYVPGPVVLILAAVATGVMLVAHRALLPKEKKVINFLANPRTGFVLIASVMVLIIASVSIGYGAVRQFVALNSYVHATDNLPNDNTQIEVLTTRLASAYNLYHSDVFARDIAAYQLAYLSYLLTLSEPTTEDRQRFQTAITNAVQAANEAVAKNPTEAQNWSLAGDIYSALAVVKIEGASDRAKEAYNEAKARDPQNPYYDMQLAIASFRADNRAEARTYAEAALSLKANYTDALFLISQVDIADGDIKKAIATTQALIALEANNPGRYYQLGVLFAADKNREASIAAYSRAIELNPNYANARYLRALQYLEAGNTTLAVSELRLVEELNPDNAAIKEVIAKIQAGDIASVLQGNVGQVSEPESVEVVNEVLTTNDVPDTDLLTPVNTVPDEEAGPSEVSPESPVSNEAATSTEASQ